MKCTCSEGSYSVFSVSATNLLPPPDASPALPFSRVLSSLNRVVSPLTSGRSRRPTMPYICLPPGEQAPMDICTSSPPLHAPDLSRSSLCTRGARGDLLVLPGMSEGICSFPLAWQAPHSHGDAVIACFQWDLKIALLRPSGLVLGCHTPRSPWPFAWVKAVAPFVVPAPGAVLPQEPLLGVAN
jgi:hypothetical protein